MFSNETADIEDASAPEEDSADALRGRLEESIGAPYDRILILFGSGTV